MVMMPVGARPDALYELAGGLRRPAAAGVTPDNHTWPSDPAQPSRDIMLRVLNGLYGGEARVSIVLAKEIHATSIAEG